MPDYPTLTRVLSLLVSVLLLFGCASRPPSNISLTKEDAAKVKAVEVHLTASTQQSYKVSKPTNSGAAHMSVPSSGNLLADVLGHVIGHSLAQSSTTHEQRIDPLLEFTKDIDFAGPFEKRFGEALKSSNWLHVKGISQPTEPLTPEARLKIRESARDVSVLFGNARYFFSADYRHVYVAADIELWLDHQSSSPAYRGSYLFCSEPVGREQDSIERYLQAWSENGNRVLRQTLMQGINETQRMLSLGLSVQDEHRKVGVAGEAMLLKGCAKPAGANGEVIAKEKNRTIILSDVENYYSVPSANH